jgi:hypothetical protein
MKSVKVKKQTTPAHRSLGKDKLSEIWWKLRKNLMTSKEKQTPPAPFPARDSAPFFKRVESVMS